MNKLLAMFKNRIAYRFFLIYFFAAAILTSVIIGFFYNRMNTTIIQDFVNYKNTEIDQISKSVDANLNSKSFQSTALIYDLDLLRPYLNYDRAFADYAHTEQEKQVNTLLNNLIITNYNNFDGIALFSMDGQLLTSACAYDLKIQERDIQQEPWFQNVINANGSAVLASSKYFLSPTQSSENEVIIIARTINDYANAHKPLGISVFYQQLSKFTKDVFTLSGRDIREGIFFITTPENALIYSDSDDDEMINDLINKTAGQINSGDTFSYNSETYSIVYNTSPIYQFSSAYLIPESVLLQKTQALRQMFIIIMVVVTAAGIVIALVISHISAAPIRHILTAARQVEQGNLDIQLNIRGNDEISQLGKNILVLVQQIKLLMASQYEHELYLKDIEFEALQAKINPHFLYNTLSVIAVLIETQDYPTARHMLENLSDIFRYCLNRGQNYATLYEEMSHVKKYLEIQKMRFKNNLQVHLEINYDINYCRLPRLTLQPIVENAIIHGFEPLNTCNILIFSQKAADTLFIYVQDNGSGMPENTIVHWNQQLNQRPGNLAKIPGNKSIGLYNVNARIKLMYGAAYGLYLMPSPTSGLTVRISIPAINIENPEEINVHTYC